MIRSELIRLELIRLVLVLMVVNGKETLSLWPVEVSEIVIEIDFSNDIEHAYVFGIEIVIAFAIGVEIEWERSMDLASYQIKTELNQHWKERWNLSVKLKAGVIEIEKDVEQRVLSIEAQLVGLSAIALALELEVGKDHTVQRDSGRFSDQGSKGGAEPFVPRKELHVQLRELIP